MSYAELPTNEYFCYIKRPVFHSKAFIFLTTCVLNLKKFCNAVSGGWFYIILSKSLDENKAIFQKKTKEGVCLKI